MATKLKAVMPMIPQVVMFRTGSSPCKATPARKADAGHLPFRHPGPRVVRPSGAAFHQG